MNIAAANGHQLLAHVLSLMAGCDRDQSVRRGFTLVEVLIVVVIIAIMATVGTAAVSDMVYKARQSAIARDLNSLRTVLMTHKAKSHGKFPQTLAELNAVLVEMPTNPFNRGQAVRFLDNIDAVTIDEKQTINGEVVGWLYHPATGSLLANTLESRLE